MTEWIKKGFRKDDIIYQIVKETGMVVDTFEFTMKRDRWNDHLRKLVSERWYITVAKNADGSYDYDIQDKWKDWNLVAHRDAGHGVEIYWKNC